MKKLIPFFVFWLSISFLSIGQQQFLGNYGIYDSIPVIVSNDSITSAWSGGLHSPISSSADMDKDGLLDLVIFDRYDNTVNVYFQKIHKGKKTFIHDPYYTQFFPKMDSWVIAYDYNNDSLADLFTTYQGAVSVYKNISKDPKKTLEWQRLLFRSPNDSTKWVPEMSYKGYYTATDYVWSALACNNLSVPALVDVEDDGDMDILVLETNGGTVTWYENVSIDSSGTPDSLDFRLSLNCWGQFQEDLSNNSINLNACTGFTSGSRHTGGSSLYVTDIDSGFQKDCFVSGAGDPKIKALYNGGTNKTVIMTSIDSHYLSSNKSVDLNFFIRPLATELSGDSLNDLLFTPANYLFNRDHNQFWYYENKGTYGQPDFQFIDSTFLYDQVIDVGTDARPLFFNVDGDSLMDLLIANSNYTDGKVYWTRIAYYKNVGDNYIPEYKLISKDFLTFAHNYDGLNLAKGDLDGDGDIDLLVTPNNGKPKWYENTAVLPTDSAQFQLKASTFDTLLFGNYSKPFLYDVDGDSLLDLLVGEQKPWLSYYKNKGSKTTPVFDKWVTNARFGGIDVAYDDPNNPPSLSPVMLEVDSSGKIPNDSTSMRRRILVLGINEGPIYSYLIDSTMNATTLDTIYSYNRNLSLTIESLNRDSLPVIVAGTKRGGLISMVSGRGFIPKPPPPPEPEDTTKDTTIVVPESGSLNNFKVYPNPFGSELHIDFDKVTQAYVSLIDLQGREIYSTQVEGMSTVIPTEKLQKGLLILQINSENRVTFYRVVHGN